MEGSQAQRAESFSSYHCWQDSQYRGVPSKIQTSPNWDGSPHQVEQQSYLAKQADLLVTGDRGHLLVLSDQCAAAAQSKKLKATEQWGTRMCPRLSLEAPLSGCYESVLKD